MASKILVEKFRNVLHYAHLNFWRLLPNSAADFTRLALIAIALLALNTCINGFNNYRHLSKIPGPTIYSLTRWRLAYDAWRGTRTHKIHELHKIYGPVVRIGPKEISFNSLSALKTIYGAGSGFERTSYYKMFEVYGEQNLFTFAGVKDHGDRKKLLSNAYTRSSILKNDSACVEQRVNEYMELIAREPSVAAEIFSSLHYFALDNITHFLYGKDFGGTSALLGPGDHREMLKDVFNPARKKTAWFVVHLPNYTKWLMTRTGFVEKVISILGLLPQKKPTVYTGIRNHALKAWKNFSNSSVQQKEAAKPTTIIGKLWPHHESEKAGGLTSMQAASEIADHLLAGVDTTSDTLLFLIWALSLPENQALQSRLISEVLAMPSSVLNEHGYPTVEASSKLRYLDAVIKETLRLYTPLPASEPRSLPTDTSIDGLNVPANTVVSMSPYALHRNTEVFKNPLVFDPDRWLGDEEIVKEMNRWFWAFSSGGRMCIGIQ